MDTTPNRAGFKISTEVHANKKAGMGPSVLWKGPKASLRYTYSAPDLVIIVPSSAYDRAPKTEKKAPNHDQNLDFIFMYCIL
jgi:hypothetical protein